MSVYGYVRVSARDQNEARQLFAMEAFPVAEANIFTDKQSGKDFQRPAYKRLVKRLCPGDLLVLMSIDRLGRNYDEILEQWRLLTKTRRVDIVVLDFPLLDTRERRSAVGGCDLTGRFIADMTLSVLAYVAEKERESTRRRQAEGIAAARARGVRFGRRAQPIPDGFSAVRVLYSAGEISSRKAGELLGVSGSTFLRWFKRTEELHENETDADLF